MDSQPPAAKTADIDFTLLGEAGENCASCRFWNRIVRENVKGIGTIAPCRRFPPTSTLRTQMTQDPITRATSAAQIPSNLPQPMTTALEWCGEFQRETRASAFTDKPAAGSS